jgi:uncharacterized protein
LVRLGSNRGRTKKKSPRLTYVISESDPRAATSTDSVLSKIKSRFLLLLAGAPGRTGRVLVRAYQLTFSSLVGFHCRHLPTCSEYSDQALARFGLWAGSWMTLARLSRCHPWGTSGLDFPPATLPRNARWYLPWRYGRWRGVNETPPPSSSGL